jgi:hypothetical protein
MAEAHKILIRLTFSFAGDEPERTHRDKRGRNHLAAHAAKGRMRGKVQVSIRREPWCLVAQDATRPGFLLALATRLPAGTDSRAAAHNDPVNRGRDDADRQTPPRVMPAKVIPCQSSALVSGWCGLFLLPPRCHEDQRGLHLLGSGAGFEPATSGL